jgi:hypothetical protein
MWTESSLWPSDVLGRYQNIHVNASGGATATIAMPPALCRTSTW